MANKGYVYYDQDGLIPGTTPYGDAGLVHGQALDMDATDLNNFDVYTVPIGKVFFPTDMIIATNTVVGSIILDAVITIGINSGTEYGTGVILANMHTKGNFKRMSFQPLPPFGDAKPYLIGGQNLRVSVVTAATGVTSLGYNAYVSGYLVDAY